MAGYLPKPSVTTCINKELLISKDIMAAYPLNELEASISQDKSGRGNDGTAGGTIAIVNTPYGPSPDFQSGSAARYTVSSSSDFSFGDGTNDHAQSMHALIKFSNITGTEVILSKDGGTREWLLYLDSSGQIIFLMYDVSSNSTRIGRKTGASTLSNNVWYSIVVTYDGTASPDGIRIYVNGVRRDNADSVSGSYTASGTKAIDFAIGGRGGGDLAPNAIYANTVIWRRLLSASEAALLYHNPFAMYEGFEDIEDLAGALEASVVGSPFYYYLQQQLLAG